MIISSGITRATPQVLTFGFVEFTTPGTYSITTGTIPAAVTRVRVHVVGAGGFTSNGGSSSFSANGVSVIATGGNASIGDNGGVGGSVSGTAGYAVATSGGATGYAYDGNQGGRNVAAYGVSMGGGSGGGYTGDYCSCYGRTSEYYGGGGSSGTDVGIGGPFYGSQYNVPDGGRLGGNGGGYGTGDTIPYPYHGRGSSGDNVGGSYPIAGGGGGGYAYFKMNLNGATAYANAITVGNCAGAGNINLGYVRIEWGPTIT